MSLWGDFKGTETPSTEQQYVLEEMNECIRHFVDNLPENYRVVVVLSELEGFKDKEIAEIVGVNLGTVKIRLHRARARLKEALEANCSLYQDERGELACDVKSAYGESVEQGYEGVSFSTRFPSVGVERR